MPCSPALRTTLGSSLVSSCNPCGSFFFFFYLQTLPDFTTWVGLSPQLLSWPFAHSKVGLPSCSHTPGFPSGKRTPCHCCLYPRVLSQNLQWTGSVRTPVSYACSPKGEIDVWVCMYLYLETSAISKNVCQQMNSFRVTWDRKMFYVCVKRLLKWLKI